MNNYSLIAVDQTQKHTGARCPSSLQLVNEVVLDRAGHLILFLLVSMCPWVHAISLSHTHHTHIHIYTHAH